MPNDHSQSDHRDLLKGAAEHDAGVIMRISTRPIPCGRPEQTLNIAPWRHHNHCQTRLPCAASQPPSLEPWTFTSAMTTSIPSWAMARAVPLPIPLHHPDDGDLASSCMLESPLLRRFCHSYRTLQWTMIFCLKTRLHRVHYVILTQKTFGGLHCGRLA